MSKKEVEAALARGVDILERFLPLKSWLLFPVLYSACVWAMRRVFDYRERILAWQVWLDPEFVRTKPDGFILDFFSGNGALSRAYADEIARGDWRVLRAAFPALYTVLGLEDAFLKALFRPELEAADYRAVVVEFAARTARARDEIRPAAADPGFWKALRTVGMEAASLGLHLLEDEEVQDLIVALIKGPGHPARSMNGRRFGIPALVLALAFSVACLAPLGRAKRTYAEGQERARALRTEQAVALWKRALDEPGRACRRRPSAQAFTVKGLAEANLGRWREAEASFLNAFRFGFPDGRSWASDAALAGLAVSFEELSLEAPALRIYAQIVDDFGFEPALMLAAERRTNLVLARSAGLEAGEKARALAALVKTLDRLVERDFACGLFHYLHAQVDGHLGEFRRSYEEAVLARELGLPSAKIGRDNDNQLVYCYVRLTDSLPPAERDALVTAQARWAAKWGWRDDRTPAWKKE